MIAGVAALSICASMLMEFIGSRIPCSLCLVQRGLHCLLLTAALVGVFSSLGNLARRSCQAILIIGSMVATYHTLVQLKIVKDRCKSHFEVEDFASYKNLLIASQKSRPSCSEDPWKFGPFPISGINGLISACLIGVIWLSRKENEARKKQSLS